MTQTRAESGERRAGSQTEVESARVSAELETSLAAHWFAIGLALLWPTLATYVYFVLLSGADSMGLVYSGAKVLQFAFPLVWVIAIQKRPPRLERPRAAPIAWGFVLGLCMAVAGLAAYYGIFRGSAFLADTPGLITAKLKDMALTTPGRYFAFAAFLALPHALLEEYYWRWFTFGQLRRVIPVRWAIAISSLGFMAHHVVVIYQYLAGSWGLTLFLSACVAAGGAAWAWLYHRQRSIYGPWVSHLVVDCVIMYIGYDLSM
jgi:membrane protease YdiL (CAAX protease family)